MSGVKADSVVFSEMPPRCGWNTEAHSPKDIEAFVSKARLRSTDVENRVGLEGWRTSSRCMLLARRQNHTFICRFFYTAHDEQVADDAYASEVEREIEASETMVFSYLVASGTGLWLHSTLVASGTV